MLEGFMDMLGLDLGNDPVNWNGTGENSLSDMREEGTMNGFTSQHMADLNGDGISDTLVVEQVLDLNGDGIMDTVQREVFSDFDGNGETDSYSVFVTQDTDQDGQAESAWEAHDVDGDGMLDYEQTWSDQDHSGILTPLISDDLPQEDGEGAGAPGYVEFFDSDRMTEGTVVGDPQEDMDNWHMQETNSSCAVASQEFVLEELSGLDFQEEDLRELAERNGWYDPNGGTPMDDVGNILEHMGLQVERSQGNDLSDLEECLTHGGKVIVGVDSSELWYGEDDDLFLPGMGADHAIQVIGIDYSDPDDPMVIVNDSGAANGRGAMVPMDVFMDAWEDSGYFMVEAYA